MDLGLRGKVALVCGASRGIAFAAAEELAMEGVELVICARSDEAIRSAKTKLEAHGVTVTALEADLATPEGIAHVVQHVQAAYPKGLDILVCNTGGRQPGRPWGTSGAPGRPPRTCCCAVWWSSRGRLCRPCRPRSGGG